MNTSATPKITVLMSVYNGEQYLRESIDSILNQTYKDFEFIIIDDSSTDKTPEILNSFEDSRIKLVRNQTNLGLTKSLNIGLGVARGAYVARMDADDIALPQRLEVEQTFLDSRQDIVCVGAALVLIDKLGQKVGAKKVLEDLEIIRFRMIVANQLAHPTVMFRRLIILEIGGYDESFKYVQDYDLWSRLIERDYLVTNIHEPLIQYRNHSASLTQGSDTRNQAYQYAVAVIRKNIARYMQFDDYEFSLFLKSFHKHRVESFREAIIVRSFLAQLKKAYLKNETVSQKNHTEIKKYIALLRRYALLWYFKQRFSILYKTLTMIHKFIDFHKK